VLSHVMGPDGKSLNIALANGGMVIPIVYEDSVNIDDILALLTSAVESIQPAGGGTLAPSAAPDHEVVH
jgi:hypothetical protein